MMQIASVPLAVAGLFHAGQRETDQVVRECPSQPGDPAGWSQARETDPADDQPLFVSPPAMPFPRVFPGL